MHYIYVIRNSCNNKVYVGQTRNFVKRKIGHLYSAKKGDHRPLYQAMREIGIENFLFEILEECTSEQVASEREAWWVVKLNSYENGYNLTSGGGFHVGNKGRKFSEDHRRKMSEAHKGKIVSEETRKKISDGQKGKTRGPMSDETREKIRQGNLGKEISEEVRLKIRQTLTGRSLTEECRHKISLANLGRVHSDETRRKISDSHKGITHSEETKQHLSKIRKGVKQGPRSEQAKKNMSAAWKPRLCKICKQPGHIAKTCKVENEMQGVVNV